MVMPRRSAGHAADKMMYGSSASIQSAPHFNYDSMSVLMKGVGRRNTGGMGGNNINGGGGGMMMAGEMSMNMGQQHSLHQQLSDPYNIAQGSRGGGGPPAAPMMKSVFSFDRIGGQQEMTTSFKWPEKIHASTVKQNDMFWNKCRELKQSQAATRYMDSSSSSSGNTVQFPGAVMRGYSTNQSPLPMPPSPARD